MKVVEFININKFKDVIGNDYPYIKEKELVFNIIKDNFAYCSDCKHYTDNIDKYHNDLCISSSEGYYYKIICKRYEPLSKFDKIKKLFYH